MTQPHKDINYFLAEKLLDVFLKFPDNKAIHINDTYISYQELFFRTKNIYNQLPTDKTYDKIGIYCFNDIDTFASIIATVLYGAAFVPLNSKFPVERNKKLIEQCGLEIVLSSQCNNDTTIIKNSSQAKVLYTGSSLISEKTISISELRKSFQPLSYILFTSGSTGLPKGVPVSNKNIYYFFRYFQTNYSFNSNDRFLQVYEPTFDVFVFSFFMPLLSGACCYFVSDEGVKFSKIIASLKQHHITVVSMVPTVLRYIEKYLPEIHLPALRYSFFSGDALYYDLAAKWSKSIPNAQLHNFYGPTETTIVCTRYVFDIEKAATESINNIVPLGQPFEGMEYIIIDDDNNQALKGELCFCGTQVIDSYLNNTHPEQFFEIDNKKYYKTGDIASANENGNLLFHGRKDAQVKINGYRIELAEVENALNNLLHAQCVVISYASKQGNKLVAFINSNLYSSDSITELLETTLPAYMIPQQFIFVEQFKLNSNGKIDKNKLLQLITV